MARWNLATATNYFSVAAPLTATPFSAAGWLKITNGGAISYFWMLTQQAVATDYWRVRWNNADNKIAVLCRSGGSEIAATSPNTVTIKLWFHWAVTTASTTDLNVYLNAGTPGTNATAKAPAAVDTLFLGCNFASGASTSGMRAEMGETTLWNEALTADDILAMARGRTPARRIRPRAIVSHWDMDGKAFSPERDRMGKNHLTVNGQMLWAPSPTLAPDVPLRPENILMEQE